MRCVLSQYRSNAKDWRRQRKSSRFISLYACPASNAVEIRHQRQCCFCNSKMKHFLQYISYQRCPGLCDIRLLKHTVCEAASQNQPEKLAHITVATLGLQGFSAVLNWSIGITSFKSCQSIPSLMSYINSISVALLAHLALIGHLIGMPELVSFHWLTNS